ncbi:MAG: dTMP kinase [Candidatus Levybacteria bacterium]|nr:dTMP kinase [Candidatus Levybacteria bacterium]
MKYHIAFDIDLKRNPYSGKYIIVEGIDGSGKTTQVEKLCEYFQKQGKEVVCTREPRKVGLIGDLIQKVLLGKTKLPPAAFQYLFSTDRVIHHQDVIIPALKAGKIVISDRCFWSAVVYGIMDKKEEYTLDDVKHLLVAQSILSMYHQFIVPDFNFYLRISLETSVARILKKKDPKEIYEDSEKIKRAVEGYEWVVDYFKKEFTIIDGEKGVGEVTEEILSHLSS